MTPFHSLGQDNQNEVQHDLFGHVIPAVSALGPYDATGVGASIMLASALHSANVVVNDTIPLLRPAPLYSLCHDN